MQGIIPFARLFNTVLQAPAAAEDMGAFNVSQTPEQAAAGHQQEGDSDAGEDRGDIVDPSLFEDDDDAPRRPAQDKAKKEEKPADDAAKDAGEDLGDAAKDDVDDEVETKAKKEPEKPKEKQESRSQKRIRELAERNAALERKLAEQTGSQQAAETIADLETQAAQLDKQYHKALAEDPEKASDLMRQIRKLDREIARIEAQAEADATVNERLEQRELQATVNAVFEQYPQLAKGHEDYDQELVNDINAVFKGLIDVSASKSAAMKRAVKMVMGDHEAQPAGLGETSKGDKVRQERKEEGARKTAETVNRQPPSTKDAGASGGKTPIAVKTIKDLDKLSEAELAQLRGDEI